jgi:hypothetical protein
MVGCNHSASGILLNALGSHRLNPNITVPRIPSTSTGADYFQAFDDNIGKVDIPTDAPSVALVWGADSKSPPNGKTLAWITNGVSIVGFYMPGFGDADSALFYNLGHTKAWWESLSSSGNPSSDWLEYQCDKTTPAKFAGLDNPVLDISNSNVIDYQADLINTAHGSYAYNAAVFDLVNVYNNTLACGHYHTIGGSHQWVAQYSGSSSYDSNYASDVESWAAAMKVRLHDTTTYPSGPYVMAINMEVNKFSNPSTSCSTPDAGCAAAYYVMQHSDVEQNESGVTGQGPTTWLTPAQFQANADWAFKVQSSEGEDYLMGAEFHRSTGGDPTSAEREYAFAGYLMGKHPHAAMYWEKNNGGPSAKYEYNLNSPSEFSYSEGATCDVPTPLYHISNNDANLFYRIFHKAVAIVNADASTTYTVSLNTFSWNQAGAGSNDFQSYFDIESGIALSGDSISLPPHTGIVAMSDSGTDLGCPIAPSPLP